MGLMVGKLETGCRRGSYSRVVSCRELEVQGPGKQLARFRHRRHLQLLQPTPVPAPTPRRTWTQPC